MAILKKAKKPAKARKPAKAKKPAPARAKAEKPKAKKPKAKKPKPDDFVPKSTESVDSPYTNLVYGNKGGIHDNNCYAWAVDSFSPDGGHKLQPGNLSHVSQTEMSLKSCSSLVKRAAADLGSRGYRPKNTEEVCKPGYYKILPFIAPNKDFHWYRQHKDLVYRIDKDDPATVTSLAKRMGVSKDQILAPDSMLKKGSLVYVKDANLYSHKRGFASGPLLKDACKKFIPDPTKACRDYGEYNYKLSCGAFCVKKK